MPHGEVEDSLKRRAEPSLQALADHLTALTDIHTSLPMALPEATKGATEWEGLGLLSGSSIQVQGRKHASSRLRALPGLNAEARRAEAFVQWQH